MNPNPPRLLRVEAVADLPVLWATFQRLDLPASLDRHFPAPPHWKGPLSPGEVLALWLRREGGLDFRRVARVPLGCGGKAGWAFARPLPAGPGRPAGGLPGPPLHQGPGQKPPPP